MSTTQPPPMPGAPASKPGMPTWAIVLIVLGVVGIVGIAVIGMLAAIAIPNFVRARETAQRNICANNLRTIAAAKQQWALENKKETTDTPTQNQISVYFPNGPFPRCPAGGIYTINAVGEDPTCSAPNHGIATRPAPTFR